MTRVVKIVDAKSGVVIEEDVNLTVKVVLKIEKKKEEVSIKIFVSSVVEVTVRLNGMALVVLNYTN